MNIAYVLSTFPQLTQTFVLNEIVELVREGHNVHVFSIFPPENGIFHEELDEFNLWSNVHYFQNPRLRLNQIKIALQSFGSFGWKHSCEKLSTKVLSIAAAKYFSEIAKDLPIDVLHAHFSDMAAHTAMLMSKKLGIPFTFTGHAVDIFVNPNKKALQQRMELASAIITISQYNRDYLHEITGVDKDKIHVVRACSNLAKLKFVKSNPEPFRILTIGRLVEKKGIRYGIIAINELIKHYPKIRYVIVGSGPLEKELRKMVEFLNLQENVEFLGNLSDDSLLEELRKATIFVLPCVKGKNGDMDGIPVALMESMYLRVPTVSTNISGVPELIETGKEGLLVEPKNVEQLANVIKTLLDDENLRVRIGENGREKIEADFNVHKEVDKLLGIWKESLGIMETQKPCVDLLV